MIYTVNSILGDFVINKFISCYLLIFCSACAVSPEQQNIRLLKEASQGKASSQYYLGLNYMRGLGVEKDNKRACDLYEKAANSNYHPAENNLGVCYAKGLGRE